MSEQSVMAAAQALLSAARLRYGDGIEGFIVAARAFAAAAGVDLHWRPAERKSRARVVARKTHKRDRGGARPKRAPAAPAPRPAAPPRQEPVPIKPVPPVAAEWCVTAHGITITLLRNAEAIEHGGAEMEINARQALFLSVLLKGSPNPIGRDFIAQKIWPGGPPATSDLALTQLTTELAAALAPIGLAVKAVRGVGIALQKIEQPAEASA